ncbi:sensor histidine kinase [Novosphingobium aquimarinum]|uniref:sensor histidine kinase n=1 Tax=Novosphingobium aquimarinum TaxID=2682494 RepID=UPI0018DC6E28|nr:PAS domain-containing sensor histidine kinase [Novosphingobium aquimarinum]
MSALIAMVVFASYLLTAYVWRIPDAGSPLGRDWGVTSPGTAITLLLNGTALLALDGGRHRLASWIATTCLIVCHVNLVGYLLDHSAMQQTLLFGYMSPITAAIAAILSMVVLCLADDGNWLSYIVRGGRAGILRGRLMLSAIVLPILVEAIIAWFMTNYDMPVPLGQALVASIVGLILAHEIIRTSHLFERLQEVSARLVAIIESSDDAIVGKDLDGRIVSWNRGAERLFGYRETEILGETMAKLIPGDRPEEGPSMLARIRQSQRLKSFQTRRVRKDGTELEVSVTASPILAADGTIVGASSITRDITDLVQINAQLLRSNAELEQFAYVASHDMREPLRMMANYAELLEEHCGDKLDDTARQYLDHVSHGAIRMQQMISDLLAYSRVDPQGRPLVPTPVEPILERVATLFKEPLAECGGELSWGEMPVVLGDDLQLGQVFQNVIGNAIKFRGEQPLQIRIDASREGNSWTFRVVDNGIGFETAHAGRIFEMFQRLHPRKQYPGSGIGLAIVRRIVDRHNGKIWVTSRPGEGTEVYFTIEGISTDATAASAHRRRQ